jgi:3',5'-cyclic AMP phosphodiesterase CpdA
VLVLVLVLVLSGCSRVPPPEQTDAATARSSSPPSPAAPPKRARRGGTDVTFCVVSDTHFGYGGMEETNARLVARVNAIAGRPYPTSGVVDRPRGLLVTGDLTEWGRPEEWQPFVRTYGLDGGDGALRIPVLEVIGNHDKGSGPWVGDQVAVRHGGRSYAWDWDDLRLVALGEAPDEEGLAFLAHELDRLAADVPVVLFFHLPLTGPFSTGHWFGDGPYRDRLAAIVRGHTIAGIFHGHHHATEHYVWNGIDVWKPGAVKNPGAHTFAVVHVTDSRISVASFDWERDTWTGTQTRALSAATSSAPD